MNNVIDVRLLTNDQMAKMNFGTEMSDVIESTRKELGLPATFFGGTRMSLWNEGRKLAKVGAIWSEDGDGDNDDHVWVKIGDHQLFGDLALCVCRTYLLAMRDILMERDLQ